MREKIHLTTDEIVNDLIQTLEYYGEYIEPERLNLPLLLSLYDAMKPLHLSYLNLSGLLRLIFPFRLGTSKLLGSLTTSSRVLMMKNASLIKQLVRLSSADLKEKLLLSLNTSAKSSPLSLLSASLCQSSR